MCFFYGQSKSAATLKNRFKAKIVDLDTDVSGIYNGFTYPKAPIIANNDIELIQFYNWGLIPHWAKDEEIRKNTLNARIETIAEKPSFRSSINKRCIILADGFYEWKWLDPKGKSKQKHLVSLIDSQPFAFAGLYSDWINKQTGEIVNTFTILTMEANELMSEIHNSKKRMPVILAEGAENDWLLQNRLNLANDYLTAIPCN